MPLSDTDKAKIEAVISVSNVDDSNIRMSWSNASTLNISFAQNLANDTAYTISMAAVNNINGVSVNGFANLPFRTMEPLTFTATPDLSNVYTAMTPKYHCRPAFTISPNYSLSALSEASKTALLNAVTISNSSGLTKAWNNDNIRLTFSSNLTPNSSHTLSMAAVDFTGITVNTFANLDFTVLDTLTFAIATGSTDVYEAMSPKYRLNPTFTITPSFALTDADKTNIENAVSVTNTSSIISKNWSENNLVITFSENLTPNRTYTLTMGNVSGMDNISLTKFSDLAFTTLPALSFTLTKDSDNVFYSGKYHCRPGFTVTPSFTVSETDRTTIASAINLTNVDESIITKTWNDNVLTLGFNQNIATSTSYTLSMSAINITGVSATPFSSFNFTTIPDLIVSIATTTASIVKRAGSSSNLEVNGKNYLYCQSPEYEVSVNMTLDDTNKAKIKDAITGEGAISALLTKSAWNGNKITLGFSSTLAASTTYRILMSEVTDIKGVNVKTIPSYSFTTFFHQGYGTEDDPFTIYTPAQLACLDLYPSQSYYYKQMEDLDLSSYPNWKPIGLGYTFYGKYNGYNKKISNVAINYPDNDKVGLFSHIYSGFLSNINIESINVSGNNYVGSLCGYSDGRISGVVCDSVNINGTQKVGCLVGYSGNIIENCSIANSFATGTDEYVGGCLGAANTGSSASGVHCENLNIRSPQQYVGGFAGEVYCSSGYSFEDITCDNITVEGKANVGGAIGFFSGNLNNCSVTNSIASGSDYYIGGCIGEKSLGNINGVSCEHSFVKSVAGYYVGGCIGAARGESSSVSANEVTVEGRNTVGGAIGAVFNGIVTNCNVTNITATGSYDIGGCFGRANSSTVNTVRCNTIMLKSEYTSSSNRGGAGGCCADSYNSEINDVICDDITIEGSNRLGGAFGYVESSTITSCNVTNSSASGTTEIGGCAGYVANNSTFNDITCEHLVVKATGDNSGGCVGQVYKDIYTQSCSFTDITCNDVNVEGNGFVGCAFGIIINGTLTTCNITDSIASSTSWKAGGCAGQAEAGAKLSGVVCQNLQINAGGDYAGGCIGQTYGNCEFSDILCDNVSVECAAGKQGLGGLMGYCINSTKDNCRVINSRVGNGSSNGVCGGLIGELGHIYGDTSTNNCFVRNTDILSTSYCIGGLFGSANKAGDISNCFVDDCRITGSDRAGGFSGKFGGDTRLNSCYVASISLDTTGDYIGGFVGRSESSITSCYTERVKILAKSHSVGGLVGYQTVDGVIELSHATKAKIEVDDISQNRQCYGGLVGQSSGTISLSYVDDSDIDSFQKVGGLVGYCPGGSVSKCFVKDTRVNAYNLDVGGLVGTVFPEAQIDSCYVKGSNISCTVEMNALNHGISGLVASNSGDITNCYTYNTTVTGKSGYGALVGINGNAGEATTIADCFIRENYSTLIDYNQNSTPLTSCYYNVGDLAAFKAQTWSDGKTIEGGSTAWSNFNRTSFPPQLTELPEP